MCRQSNGLSIYRKRAASHRHTVDHHHLLGHLSRTAGQPAVNSHYQFLYGDGRLDYCPSGNLFSNYFIDRSAQKIPKFKQSILLQAIYAGITGMLFGFFISAVQAPFLGISAFLPYYLAGIPVDTMHAFGNVIFYLLLAPALKKLLTQTIQRWRNMHRDSVE